MIQCMRVAAAGEENGVSVCVHACMSVGICMCNVCTCACTHMDVTSFFHMFATYPGQVVWSLLRSSTLKELACTIGSTILTIFSEALVSTNSE